jgi:GAF domain-containing protein
MRDDINQLLADAARDLAEEPTFVTTLERTVELCTQAVEHCEVAGVALVESHEIRTLAATGPALRRVGELQLRLRLREGPCYGALRKHETLVSDDLSVDPRWPDGDPAWWTSSACARR